MSPDELLGPDESAGRMWSDDLEENADSGEPFTGPVQTAAKRGAP